ncbi:DUF3253 domain-containing protein [Microbacterium sp.]|uniref:DUF3253 domain-containing protein n=1 Tax=Microbacterium sp. TaxID=51671 RepID=UPI00373638E4
MTGSAELDLVDLRLTASIRKLLAGRADVATGEVEITQGGEVVDLAAAKGPIRIRRAR